MASLAAARRWCRVTSTDYVPALLENGRARAEAEGLPIEFIEADAEHLPFDKGDFDTVLSTFGVMFTPNQDLAADELLRVCRPKGQIGLANWTPEGFIGQMFKTLAKYLPPPPNAKSPALWGTRERLAVLFGSGASEIKAESRHFNFRYRSPTHFLNVFETYYGPIHRAFASLDQRGQIGLRDDLHALIVRMNRANDGTMIVPSEYLEVVIRRR
jgi:SAM-dependent methyltransferase